MLGNTQPKNCPVFKDEEIYCNAVLVIRGYLPESSKV
jgi:hypothetical protein